MIYARLSGGFLVTAKKIATPAGVFDAGLNDPPPTGWQIVENQSEAGQVDESGFSQLTRRQLLEALFIEFGITEATVLQLIDAMPSGTAEEIAAKELARIAFIEGPYGREHPLIQQMSSALGLSKQAVDDAWLKHQSKK